MSADLSQARDQWLKVRDLEKIVPCGCRCCHGAKSGRCGPVRCAPVGGSRYGLRSLNVSQRVRKVGEISGSAFLAFHRTSTNSWDAHTCQLGDMPYGTCISRPQCCWHVLKMSSANTWREGGEPGICILQGNLGRFSALVDQGEKNDFPSLLFRGRIEHREVWDQVIFSWVNTEKVDWCN